jgi:hypothetical protein
MIVIEEQCFRPFFWLTLCVAYMHATTITLNCSFLTDVLYIVKLIDKSPMGYFQTVTEKVLL